MLLFVAYFASHFVFHGQSLKNIRDDHVHEPLLNPTEKVNLTIYLT